MEPRLWQLKNRIKWVSDLRSGNYTEIHSQWHGKNKNEYCVLGVANTPFLAKSNRKTNWPDKLGVRKNINNMYFYHFRYDNKYLNIADYYGLNYLELYNIANLYEGYKFPNYDSELCLNFKQIANIIEGLHIRPYNYMLGRYYPNKTIAILQTC